ncbi:hypothetical protein N9V96_04155 [Polaribacter sp.]|nr:hypothetical protein [Polaribacter sp.]
MNEQNKGFTYDIHMEHQQMGEITEMGSINFQKFMGILDKFPWIEQHYKSLNNQKGSATINVHNLNDNSELWVSTSGDEKNILFIIGYACYTKKRKNIFSKKKLVKIISTYSTKVYDLNVYSKGDIFNILHLYGIFFTEKKMKFLECLLEFQFHSEQYIDNIVKGNVKYR